jgi:hypothetical protein
MTTNDTYTNLVSFLVEYTVASSNNQKMDWFYIGGFS